MFAPERVGALLCEEDEGNVSGAGDEGGGCAKEGALSQLSIESVSDMGRRYVLPDGIYAQLRCNLGAEANVKLLKWSWLDARAEEMRSASTDEERRRLALPRRQDIEATDRGAFYTAAEIAALPRGNVTWAGGPLAVVAISHCWETASHPDPVGRTLLSIARSIRRAQKEHIGRHHELLPGDIGIFLDWCSLHQKDANGERTATESACFAEALGSMQLWYAHQLTTCLLLVDSGGAHSASGLGYDARGWTTFEWRVAMLAKRTSDWAWPLLLTSAADADTRALRGPPLTPEAFEALLETKSFTNGKSDRALVVSLYSQTAASDY